MPETSLRATVSEFFDDETVARFNTDTASGSALPNVAYTSHRFYQFEQQAVFRKTWVFAAFAHRLPQTGSLMPIEIAGQPIVLVRGNDDVIRAFHNVCSHRGAKLVNQSADGRKLLVCPNHSWSYSLEGKLQSRPHFYGGDKHDIITRNNPADSHRADLVEVRCETWHDWVFVNLDGNATDLSTHLQPITRHLVDYDFSELRFGEAIEFNINANWKLAIENFIEPYHVFSCHPWLNSFVGMAEREPPTFENHVLSCGYTFEKTDPARGQGLPYFSNLPDDKRNRGDWYVLFPNFAFEIFPDQMDVFIARPEGPDRCCETIAIYFVGAGTDAEEYAEARNNVMQNWHDLNNEDIGIIERMQQGRSSDGFDGGVLSPYWDPVSQHFARLVFQSMSDSEANHT